MMLLYYSVPRYTKVTLFLTKTIFPMTETNAGLKNKVNDLKLKKWNNKKTFLTAHTPY